MKEANPEVLPAAEAPQGSPGLLPTPLAVNPESLAAVYDEANEQTVAKIKQFQEFVRGQLKAKEDYGVIPGTGNKPTLLKPGAEKMLTFHGFGFQVELDRESSVEQFDLSNPVLRFVYIGRAVDKRTGLIVADGVDGEANTFEAKWRYRWVFKSEVPKKYADDDLPNKKFKGNDGKWQTKLRIPMEPDEILGQANTIRKMAFKRCLVALALAACRASGAFTQDLDEMRGADSEGRGAPASSSSSDGSPGGGPPMSAKQLGFIQKLCQEGGVDGAALDKWCRENLDTPWAVQEDGKWVHQLSGGKGGQASELIDALKEGRVTPTSAPAGS